MKKVGCSSSLVQVLRGVRIRPTVGFADPFELLEAPFSPLKERKPGVRVVAVEPAGGAVLSGGSAENHCIPGIGVGFIPDVLNRSIIDEAIPVTDEEAFRCRRRLAREEGIIAGVSSGAAVHEALTVASRKNAAGKVIVVLLADTGERYITTGLFAGKDDSNAAVG